MKGEPRPVASFRVAVIALATWSAGTSRAEEIWAVRGGTTTVAFEAGAMGPVWLQAGDGGQRLSAAAERRSSWVFPIDGASTLTFTVDGSSIGELLQGQIMHIGHLSVLTPQHQRALDGFIIGPDEGGWIEQLRATDAATEGDGGLLLDRIKLGFDAASQTLTIHSGLLRIAPGWAESLGDPGLADHALGTVTVSALADWVGGTAPAPTGETPASGDGWSRVIGCDMTFCQLYGLFQPAGGRVGDVVGLAVATTSWNVGGADCLWFPMPIEDHPFIIMNLYRLKADRFEQIGQSWVKHGFYALGSTQCGGPCTYEPGHSAGRWLGVGCTDTYSAPLNAGQNGLGPRHEVNPWTGEWDFSGSHNSQGTHSHNGIEHRIQVHDADLDPTQNLGATYYAEGFYAMPDDIDAMNSASWKPVTVSGVPGGTWTFGMTGHWAMPEIGFAIDAWGGAQQTVLAQEVPPEEFVSP
ncbi:MAG: hypothetical protein ACYSVY_13905, partial [Planctomycetota bacterium]